jgi:twinkle protein
MKITSSVTGMTYDIEFKKEGENCLPCPECSGDKKNKKPFSFNYTKKVGTCFKCKTVFTEWKPKKDDKVYKVPGHKNNTAVSELALKWFEKRMISQKTLIKMKVYSDTEYMPQVDAKVSTICYPFFLDEKLVNIKYRSHPKNFKLFKDAELIFYNINALKNAKEIVIVEGEMDCLSFVEAGIDYCISVPNGAGGNNLEYLDNYIDLFDTVEKIYLATDNDIKGIELRNELLRRFGQEKCVIVLFGDCKDANEYLSKHGALSLAGTLKTAFEIPVSGIVNLNNHYDAIYSLYVNGLQKGKTIGVPEIDEYISWETSRLAVVTGVPSHGKSEMVDYIVMRLNVLHGWKAGYFSPENYPVENFYAKLASKLIGKEFKQGKMNEEEFEESYDYISENFFFIYPEDDITIDNILAKAKYLVKKRGIKILVIDPYNKVDHMRDRGDSETEYISKLLDKLTSFCKKHNILIILVAHPRKMEKKDNGSYAMPTLYDINGSANFYNKCDFGMCVYRDYTNNTTQFVIMKVKFKHLGGCGAVNLTYNYNNGRYENVNSSIHEWHNENYLHPTSIPEPVKTVMQQIEPNRDFEYTAFVGTSNEFTGENENLNPF